MSTIYIIDSKERWINIFIAIFVTGTLIYLTIIESSLLSSVDQFTQGILSHLSFNHPLFNKLILFLFAHLLLDVYIIAFWFLLWGFKHKLLATWGLMTYISANILAFVVNKLLQLTSAHTPPVIDLTFLKLTILIYLIYICILPNISHFSGFLLMIFNFIILIFRSLAGIQLHTVALSTILISILTTYILIQIYETLYLHQFIKLQRIRLFRHSDFN